MQHAGGAAPPPGPPGPSALRSWAAPRFAADPVEELVSSPNIGAHDVLSFALEHLFAWGDVIHTRFQRKLALGFVTKWLGRDPPGESSRLPSLARLCAQRIAMDIFPAVCDVMNRHLSTPNVARFIDALRAYFAHGALGKEVASMLKEKGVPPHLQDAVAEEVFIFAIVYFLCVDIRTMAECPPPMEDMHLPIGDEDDDDGDEEGEERLDKIMAAVPNCGRGILAKVGILTHALCISYKRNVMLHIDCAGLYHVHVIQNLFDEREKALSPQHPFARSVALAPISSLLHAMLVSGNDPVFYDSFLTKIYLPWVGRTSGPDKSTYFYLRLATKNSMSEQNFDDLPPFSTQEVVVGECMDAYYADDLLDDNGYGYKAGHGVKRFRLNGNFSKGEILHSAIVSKDATLVDLEHCWNLDEECLGLALHHLQDVKVVLLKGTPINETSDVIKSANVGRKQRIKFVFSDACKCCGERNGTIKELQLSRPRKVQRTS